jgi:hypothetical protein
MVNLAEGVKQAQVPVEILAADFIVKGFCRRCRVE